MLKCGFAENMLSEVRHFDDIGILDGPVTITVGANKGVIHDNALDAAGLIGSRARAINAEYRVVWQRL